MRDVIMPQSLRRAHGSGEINSLDAIRPQPAKAALPDQRESLADPRGTRDDRGESTAVNRVNDSQSPLRTLIAESIRAVSSQKAAATDMRIDPAQLARQLQSGHLTVERLEALGPTFAAKFGEELVRTYGPLADPKQAARKSLESIEDEVRQLRQFVEHIA